MELVQTRQTPMKTKFIILLFSIFFLVGCSSEPKYTDSFYQMSSKYHKMTSIQKSEYLNGLPGKPVVWGGNVFDVRTDGTIQVDKYDFIYLTGTPTETSRKLEKGDYIKFSGVIDAIDFNRYRHPGATISDVQIHDMSLFTEFFFQEIDFIVLVLLVMLAVVIGIVFIWLIP